jgi:DNA-directed RNA polymerase subunit RPC12/RpoP
MSEHDDSPSQPQRLRCPGCGEEVEVSAESAGELARCAYCNTDFFASKDQSHLPVVDDTKSDIAEIDRQNAFDKLRIDNYAALRLSAIRARSLWLIGLCLAIFTEVSMLGGAIDYVRMSHRWGWWPSFELLIAVLAGRIAFFAWRRMQHFKREMDHSAIPEPDTPPDFSALGDGRDRWKDLENVR